VSAREIVDEIIRRVITDKSGNEFVPYVVRLSEPATAQERLQLLACRMRRQPIAIMPAKCATMAEWLERCAPLGRTRASISEIAG
jgi:hypothetical protein